MGSGQAIHWTKSMPRERTDTRTRLARAALKIAYRHGFGDAALTDIAKEARVPLGNVYYYFKTKDEIGNAVIDLRIGRLRKLLEELDQLGSPRAAQAWRAGCGEFDEIARAGTLMDGDTVQGPRQGSRLARACHSSAFRNAGSIVARPCVS